MSNSTLLVNTKIFLSQNKTILKSEFLFGQNFSKIHSFFFWKLPTSDFKGSEIST